MKRLISALLGCLACTGMVQAQDAKPDLLLYVDALEYQHEVRLGVLPYYIVWVRKGPALERAARQAFAGAFGHVGMCEGTNGADVIVWLQPQLSYSPPMETYHAQVTARFFRADGKALGSIRATGVADGEIGSQLVESSVQAAFDTAMRAIAAQYGADADLQGKIDPSLPKAPCALVALVPNL